MLYTFRLQLSVSILGLLLEVGRLFHKKVAHLNLCLLNQHFEYVRKYTFEEMILNIFSLQLSLKAEIIT